MDSLIHHLGAVLMEAREDAGISRERLAATEPEGITTNTLFRFEKGTNARYWPRDPEAFVQLYADAIGVEPASLWAEALKRWQQTGQGAARSAARGAVQQAATSARQRSESQKRTRPRKRQGNR